MSGTQPAKRDKRLTTNVTEAELQIIRENARLSGYGPKATGSFIRDQLLNSLSEAEQATPTIVPSVSEQTSKDLHGAVHNLNQFMREMHRLRISNSSEAVIKQADGFMSKAMEITDTCKKYGDFLAKGKNLSIVARFVLRVFTAEQIRKILEQREKYEAAQ